MAVDEEKQEGKIDSFIREDGSILLNMDYFKFATGLRMVDEKKWDDLFGVPKRPSESDISLVYMNMALAIQQVTEEVVLLLCQTARDLTKSKNLVLAGGVGGSMILALFFVPSVYVLVNTRFARTLVTRSEPEVPGSAIAPAMS